MHGNMSYMERNFDKRLDPRLLVDGAKSVVSFVLNYFPEAKQIDPEAPKDIALCLWKRLPSGDQGKIISTA